MAHDPTTLEKKRRELEKEKERLEKEIAKLGDKTNDAHSEEDSAQLMEQFQGNLALGNNLIKMLEDVKKALEKIGAGSYGICEFCKQDIAKERLDIYPASFVCVACETKRGKKRWWMMWKR